MYLSVYLIRSDEKKDGIYLIWDIHSPMPYLKTIFFYFFEKMILGAASLEKSSGTWISADLLDCLVYFSAF